MSYSFKYQTTAFDLWQLSMYGIYGSILGVCNGIFTAAMIILSITFWGEVNTVLKVLMLLGIGLFTVIQPLLVYLRARKQVTLFSETMSLEFDDKGVHIKTAKEASDLKWNTIKGVLKKPTMIVVLSTFKHGFILNNRVLGDQRQEFYGYINSKIKH